VQTVVPDVTLKTQGLFVTLPFQFRSIQWLEAMAVTMALEPTRYWPSPVWLPPLDGLASVTTVPSGPKSAV